jgi:thymidylate synthase (FAD)
VDEIGALTQVAVLDYGFVRLDNAMADDLSVVNAARVSFAQRSTSMSTRDEGLIRFLMRERHGSPFEHNAFRFHIKCPIFVMREWARHRIGSFNEWSGRYSQLEPEFYLPHISDMRTQVGKPGSYTYEALPVDQAAAETVLMDTVYQEAYGTYLGLLERGVAKEVARLVLPVAIYTQFYWTVNARSLMNFLSLRNAPNAQREIRVYAEAVESFFEEQMPLTWSAWAESGREAP